jgi:hypothetical protein
MTINVMTGYDIYDCLTMEHFRLRQRMTLTTNILLIATVHENYVPYLIEALNFCLYFFQLLETVCICIRTKR